MADPVNIYQSPDAELSDETRRSEEEIGEVLIVARRQKAVIYTILGYFILAALVSGLPPSLRPLVQILGIPFWLAIIIFSARLCWRVYSKPVAVLLVILSVVPLVNLLVLVAASSRATKEIKKAGFKVGFMGANIAKIQRGIG